MPGVERKLDVAIVGERGIGHLDHEEDILRPRGRRGAEVVAPAQQREVRLGLGVLAEHDRVLHRDERAFSDRCDEKVARRCRRTGACRAASMVFITSG